METLLDLVREGADRFDRRPALLIRPFFRTRTWRYRDLAATVPRAAPDQGFDHNLAFARVPLSELSD